MSNLEDHLLPNQALVRPRESPLLLDTLQYKLRLDLLTPHEELLRGEDLDQALVSLQVLVPRIVLSREVKHSPIDRVSHLHLPSNQGHLRDMLARPEDREQPPLLNHELPHRIFTGVLVLFLSDFELELLRYCEFCDSSTS